MNAHPRARDEILVDNPDPSYPPRQGEIIEVIGEEGDQHYRVRWSDGQETLFYPGTASYTFVAHSG